MSKNSTEVTRKPLAASNKKPLVMSSNKFKKLITTIKSEETAKNEAEDEQRYKEYLKKGSEELVAKWTTTSGIKRTQDQKQAERKQRFMEKIQKEKTEYLKLVAKDEKVRQDKIAKAQELIHKLKEGPKDLQSAAILSETLKGRAVQRNINKEFEDSIKKHTVEERHAMERQAMPWIEEDQRRIANNIQRTKDHKAEILSAINERSRKREEAKKFELLEGKLEQDTCDQEIKAQIEKEQEMLKRKRETLRKNALEAMIMVEQRKAREQIQETIEDKLINIYNENKRNIKNIHRSREAQLMQDRHDRGELNAQRLVAVKAGTRDRVEEHLRKDISTIQLQFTAQEQEKIQRTRQQKLARIQEYFRELNAAKDRKQRELEDTRVDLATRLKNLEVTAAFEQKLKEDQMKKIEDNRKALSGQIEERRRIEKEEKEQEKLCTTISFEDEDNFFFDYADKLVSDSVAKGRPLYPFLKAVEKYKKENDIGPERKLPPHLETQLRIGLQIPPMSGSDKDVIVSPGGTVRKYGLTELKGLNPYSPRCQ